MAVIIFIVIIIVVDTGEQGWPSVTYNQRKDEFFALYHFRSIKHFGNVHVIMGQRIQTKVTALAGSPRVVVTGRTNGGKRKAPITHPTVIYNHKTGEY